MTAKTILVTGSTDGIGHETARQLLALGHLVLVHGRSETKASARAADLAQTTGGRTQAVWGDLSQMAQVVELAHQVHAHAPVLDVLIHNAGVYERERRLTADGFETTMAVNHFAPFLLTRHLLSSVAIAPAGRIVVVSSMTHQSARLPLDDLTFARRYDGYAAYSASKLANVLFTRALARRLTDSPVTVNALHPGVIDTKLLRAGFGARGASVEQGARTSVYLATSGQVDGVTGGYFVDARQTSPSKSAQDEVLGEALWRESERLLAAFL
ncbi:MAG: SDR family oxidoreductase [Burkholderiales bacterium]|nr:SDR family oxidoreductase [Burkholderiales bacterium]